MIDDKKLICVFIYSAYESGYCGLMLDPETKEKHKQLYRNYIEKGIYFPKEEIDETQKKMMDSISNTGIRDYVYRGHFEVVRERIEEEATSSFIEAVKSPLICNSAINCPISYYEVMDTDGNEIMGKNILYNSRKKLRILKGLEIPKVKDIVSGHWEFMLEIVSNWNNLEENLATANNYYAFLKNEKKDINLR